MNDQEKRELMTKAAVKFEGKWPSFEDSDEEEWGEGEKGLAVCILDFSESEEYSVGDIEQVVISGCCKTVWQPFCNQQEFEAFMDDLADKAPEGAEYAALSDDSAVICYYCDIEDDCYEYCYEGESHWNSNIGKPIQGPLIPLPKREPAPWVPEVGQECEAFLAIDHNPRLDDWVWCICAGRLSNGAYLLEYNDGSFDCAWSKTKFRPLRTEAEIARQALYDSLCELDADLDDYQINCLIEFIQGRDND